MSYAEGLFKKGKLEEAAYAFDQIKIPSYMLKRKAQKFHNMGIIYVKLSCEDKAYLAFEKAVHYDPDNIEAYCLLGRLAYEKGDFSKAQKYFENALGLRPDRDDIRDFLHQIKK